MSAHTPGPWIASVQRSKEGRHLGWIVEASEGRGGRIGWPSRAYADTNEEAPRDGKEQEANARLIAAAPDLLGAADYAAEAIASVPAGFPVLDRALEHLRAAIAKAEGR